MTDKTAPKAVPAANDIITPEQIEKMTPAQQRQVAHTLRETIVFLSNVSEEDVKKLQAIPWDKMTGKPDPKRPLTDEDKESYKKLMKLVEEGHIAMAQVLGYTEDELFKIYNTGQALSNQGKYEDALKIADGLLFLIPNFLAANMLKGDTLRKMGKYEESLECYNKAVSANPLFIQSYWERAKLFFAIKNMPNYLLDLESVVSLDPQAKTVFGKRAMKILEAAEQELLKQGYSPEQIADAQKEIEGAMVAHPADRFPEIDKQGNQVLPRKS
jgi:tetratricopeptide (TPR) repeat protein